MPVVLLRCVVERHSLFAPACCACRVGNKGKRENSKPFACYISVHSGAFFTSLFEYCYQFLLRGPVPKQHIHEHAVPAQMKFLLAQLTPS